EHLRSERQVSAHTLDGVRRAPGARPPRAPQARRAARGPRPPPPPPPGGAPPPPPPPAPPPPRPKTDQRA
ncbi:hypothetical protein OFL41_26925, partial [Pseudomonas aeruginosa]|uniref:hypothetical protein n=1 Tax=Pseudomonas aeruginosa TaxID=287 RepID=UPI0021F22FE2